MKKIIAIMMATGLMLTGCGGNVQQTAKPVTESTIETTTEVMTETTTEETTEIQTMTEEVAEITEAQMEPTTTVERMTAINVAEFAKDGNSITIIINQGAVQTFTLENVSDDDMFKIEGVINAVGKIFIPAEMLLDDSTFDPTPENLERVKQVTADGYAIIQ